MHLKREVSHTSSLNLALPSMTDKEFKAFSSLIYDTCGIKMTSAKKQMLKGRLAKLIRNLNIGSFEKYYDYICDRNVHPEEFQKFINQVTTNKTDFLREPRHFEYMETVVLPKLFDIGRRSGNKKINIWSAGCSTGEEPYTLAMLVSEFLKGRTGWDFSVMATDLSTKVLQHAALGVYDHARVEPLPISLRKKYLMRSKKKDQNKVRVNPFLREKINFRQLNFMDRSFSDISKKFDMIFCRNVLIYFDKKTQEEVIGRLCQFIKPDGYLFLGHSETIQGYRLPLVTVESTVYRKTKTITPQGVGFLKKKPS